MPADNHPNMQYAMFENTTAAIDQVLRVMEATMDDGDFLNLSDSEAEFLDDMDNLLEEFQEMLEKYREHAGLTVEITLEGDEEEDEHAA